MLETYQLLKLNGGRRSHFPALIACCRPRSERSACDDGKLMISAKSARSFSYAALFAALRADWPCRRITRFLGIMMHVSFCLSACCDATMASIYVQMRRR